MLPSIITMLVLAQAPIDQARPQENPLARAALDAIAVKCVQCHGPEVPHPKAAFGYVTDLNRLVASGKYIVPGDLGESELWQEIDEGDMPPDNARAGALTPQETEAIRQWILGGAPPLSSNQTTRPEKADARAETSSTIGCAPEGAPTPQPGPKRLVSRLVALLGRFHVLVVHFPIALLLVAALAEAWDALSRSGGISSSVRLCLTLGALAATVAAGLGWILALDGFAGPLTNPTSITGLHRWIGTAVGVIAPAVAILSERDARRGRRSMSVRLAIVLLALTVGATGHFGGLLVHGSGFFDL